MIKHFSAIVSALSISACAAIDTGVIDYRRAEIPQNVSSRIANYPDTNCPAQNRAQATNGRDECAPLLGTRLFRKNVSRQPGIQPEEVYSIRLDYAYINFVNEIPFSGQNLLSGRNPLRSNAEIVVLARAFEFAPAPGPNGTPEAPPNAPAADSDAGFLDLTTPSLSSARVIYYSPDIENGQSLNFSNIPIIGPVKYNGRPVGIQIIVLELDRVSEEMRGLLSNLASLGQTTGVLPGGQAVDILTQLGSSLLAGNQDDIIFEYRFVLDRSSEAATWNHAVFEEGRYVLRRLHHRNRAHVWRNLELDHNTGQLFTVYSDSEANPELYRGETYFTVNIINHGRAAAEAAYAHRTLSQLQTAITEAARDQDAALTTLGNSIAGMTRNARGDILVRDLTLQWERVVADAMLVGSHTPPPDSAFASGQCRRIVRPQADLYRAQFSLARNLAQFRSDWVAAVARQGAATATFGDAEQLRVAANVGSFFAGLTDRVADPNRVAATDFTTAAAFQALINGSLDQRTTDYAAAVAPTDCASAIAAGFAEAVTPAVDPDQSQRLR